MVKDHEPLDGVFQLPDVPRPGIGIEGRAVAATLNGFFLDGWNGPPAKEVDPYGTHAPPQTSG